MKTQPGVYMIRHQESGRTYVGSSKHVPRRIMNNINTLRRGRHANHALQADWSRYGPEAFMHALLEALNAEAKSSDLDAAERRWCLRLREDGINLYCVQIAGRAPEGPTVPGLRRERLLHAALSQRDLAQRARVSPSTIARIESGSEATPTTVRKLAAALGVNPKALIEPDRA